MAGLCRLLWELCGFVAEEVATAALEARDLGDAEQQPLGASRPPHRAPRAAAGGQWDQDEYAAKVAGAIPADVRLFSGCADSQTSADLSNLGTLFSLGPTPGSSSAGGACTMAFLDIVRRTPDIPVVKLVYEMRAAMQQRQCTQVPQLSASRPLDLDTPFSLQPAAGRRRALLIGINYVGSSAQLRGCVNDALNVRQWLVEEGFIDDPDHMRVLTDDKSLGHPTPTRANIIAALQWLVEGAAAGDSLFFHYSGHGAQLPDDNGDETDGLDETILPVDFETAGQIRDDVLFQTLVLPLPSGVRLTALMDCCHSGTALDLPYLFDPTVAPVDPSGKPVMVPNPNFNLEELLQTLQAVVVAYQKGGLGAAFVAGLTSDVGQRAVANLVASALAGQPQGH